MKPQSRSAHSARLINGFDADRSNVGGYCRQHRINEHSFYAWRKRLRQQSEQQPQPKLTFLLLDTQAPPQPPIEILLAGGAAPRVACDERAIRVVLAALS